MSALDVASPIPPQLRADWYDALRPITPGYLEGITRLLQGAEDILELGCGTGRLLAPLAGLFRRVVGVDRDSAMLGIAQRRLAPAQPLGSLVLGDFTDLSLGGQTFDAAFFSRNTLGLVPDPVLRWQALVSIRRHLRPHGRIVLVQDNPSAMLRQGMERTLVRVATLSDSVAVRLDEQRVFDVTRWERYGVDLYRVTENGRESHFVDAARHGLVTRGEIEVAAAAAGLRVQDCLGGFDGQPFDGQSPLLVMSLGVVG